MCECDWQLDGSCNETVFAYTQVRYEATKIAPIATHVNTAKCEKWRVWAYLHEIDQYVLDDKLGLSIISHLPLHPWILSKVN